jgi:hypothetical protein
MNQMELRRDGDYWLIHNGLREIARLEIGSGNTDNIAQQWHGLRDMDESVRALDFLMGVTNGIVHCAMVSGGGEYDSPEDTDGEDGDESGEIGAPS